MNRRKRIGLPDCCFKGSDQRGTKEKKQRFLCGVTKRFWILKTADLGFCGRGDEARRRETLPARRRRTSRCRKAENRCTRCCRHSTEEDPGRNVPGHRGKKKQFRKEVNCFGGVANRGESVSFPLKTSLTDASQL